MSYIGGAPPPVPPEKGAFPLDHFGECKEPMRGYMACMSKSKGDSNACREEMKKYLVCRMDKELMSRESLEDLGFFEKNRLK
mmetsp:Transcript_32024/g.80346  ORF Transcript_32024/g.80346 Transcript_32024/m.80346 type:complete len:82 (-) Transcript_32024:9-254(-)